MQPVHVHALPETLQALRDHSFNGVIWPDFTRLPSVQHPILVFHELAVGDVLSFPARGALPERVVHVLPAAHTVPAVGFGVETPLGWWVFTGDTGPNPELWDVLAGQKIAQLVIETAFGDEEAYLAEISGTPVAADIGARVVATGWRGECVHHAPQAGRGAGGAVTDSGAGHTACD